MANVSQIKLPNGTAYDIEDNSGTRSEHNHYFSDLVPIMSKTYSEGYYATAANQATSTFYFMSIRPETFNKPWRVNFKVYTWVPGQTAYHSITYSTFMGRQTDLTYKNFNEMDTTGHYYITFMPLTSTGFTAGYGHAVAMSLFYASNYTNSSYKRNFIVEVYDTENCAVTLLDQPVLQANWTGYNTTNYTTLVNSNGASRGLQETSDNNDVNYYHRLYSNRFKTKTALYRYQILFTIDNDTVLPANAVNNSFATTKALTTESFDPFGPIYYYNSTTTYSANAVIAADGALYDQYRFDLRYSFNTGTTLTAYKLVYLVMKLDDNGRTAKLHSTPITQTEPTTEDGLLYKLLGIAYNTTSVELFLEKPVFWYKNGEFQKYTNDSDTKNTAGSTNTSSKIFLIGATSQAANPQTYSHDTAYVGTDGKLYSASKVVLVGGDNASSSVTITPTTTDVYSMTSAGSVTAGTKASFTRGTFSQGTLPTMTWAMDSTDTKKLNITFSQGTLPTHAADSFTANTPTAVTLPGRSSAIKAWTGYSAATAAAQTFTGVTA